MERAEIDGFVSYNRYEMNLSSLFKGCRAACLCLGPEHSRPNSIGTFKFVVLKIIGSFWLQFILRHLIFGVPNWGPDFGNYPNCC